jgi:hypothetical protein
MENNPPTEFLGCSKTLLKPFSNPAPTEPMANLQAETKECLNDITTNKITGKYPYFPIELKAKKALEQSFPLNTLL